MLDHAAHDQIRTKVHKLLELPAISPYAQKLLAVMGDDDITIEALADIIRQDASLSARIIGLANSAYFGQAEPITSIEDAVFKALGLRLTMNMAMGIALAGPFDGKGVCPAFDLHDFWLKAVLTGSLAQSLCAQMKAPNKPSADDAYLAGMLHKFGLLPLVYLFPEEMNDVFEETYYDDMELRREILEALDTDHREVGAWLAVKWQIPKQIIAVIANHTIVEQHAHATLINLIYFCSRCIEHYSFTGEWDTLPDDVLILLEKFDLTEASVNQALQEQYSCYASMESLAGALT